MPVAWWLIGDLSSVGFAPDELDYMVRAPEFLERHAAAAGVVGAVLTGACAAMLGWLYIRGHIERRWPAVVAEVAVLGVLAGGAARIVTAGVIGANIGGGLVVLIVPAGIFALRWVIRSNQPRAD